jgi:Skp family chaperone for outer membrane proteins
MRMSPTLSVALLGLLAARPLAAQAPPAPRDFKPARIAVVDIAGVFENYQKKKDIEARLEAEAKVEEKKFQKMDSDFKALIEELKNVQEGSDKHKELTLKKTQLEYEIKNRQKELLKEFQEKQLGALREIRGEIVSDIEKYAASMEIDLVLEKKVPADNQQKIQAVPWVVVHYVKPELEITDDIVKRLNAQYGKPQKTTSGKP